MNRHIKMVSYIAMIYGGTTLMLALSNIINLSAFSESLAIYTGQVQFASAHSSSIVTTIIDVLTFIESYLALIISIPAIIGGYGLYYHKSWGRYTLLLVSILMLIKIPLGTFIGIYSIWVLTRPSSVRMIHASETA